MLESARRREGGTPPLSWRGVRWLLLYATGLGLAHYFVIAPAFSYLGFEKRPPNLAVAAVLLVPYVLCARRLPASWERPSALVYWFLFLLVVAPIHVLPVFTADIERPMWLMVASVAAAFWLLGLIYRVRPPTIPRPRLTPKAFRWGFCLVWAGLAAVVVSQYGFQLDLVSLTSVYDLRTEFREAGEHVPKVARYAVTWLGEVIGPVALAYGLYHRRYLILVAAVVTQVFLVSLTGFKSMLFSMALVAAVVVLSWTGVRRLGRTVAMLVAGGVLTVTAYDFLAGSWQLSSLFVRRMILTAAVNTHYHFEFFSEYPPARLGHSVLGAWVDYPYSLPPARLIGLAYYGNAWTSANANLWADAFSNFGLVGVFGFTAVLAVALLLIDGAARRTRDGGKPHPLMLAALVVPSVSLCNSAMLTVFLTHGFMLAALVVYLLPVAPETVRERRVLVLNHFALPRSVGGGTRHVELFGRLGGVWSFLIVASNRNNYTRQTFRTDDPGFVTVPTPDYRSNGPGRVLNWLWYAVGAFLVGLRQRRVDVVYASSPHLLTPLTGYVLAVLKRAAFVLEIRDLWPRSMVELGYLREGSRLHRVLVGLEGMLYRKADRIVVTSAGYPRHIAGFGVPEEKVTVIWNGADPEDFRPTRTREEARKALDLPLDGFVAVYAGAHGPANGLDQVLDAAAALPRHTFLLVGDGLDKRRLRDRARAEGLENVRFLDPVPKENLADLLVAADVGLHVLTDTALFHEGISANKLYDYLACGLPAITNVRGESSDAVTTADAGVACEPNGLAEAVRRVSGLDPAERAAAGERGRDYVRVHRSRTAMAERLRELLDGLVAERARSDAAGEVPA